MHKCVHWTILHAQKSVHENIKFVEPCMKKTWSLDQLSQQETICYENIFLPEIVVFVLNRWSISLVLSPKLVIKERNIFQKRGMDFIHLKVNSLLIKIYEVYYTEQLTIATVIGLSNQLNLNLKQKGITRYNRVWLLPRKRRESFF